MATWDELPADAQRQILARLPAAAVQRSRAVCPAWLQMIDDDNGHFISMWRQYRRRRPPMPLFFLRSNFSLGSLGPEEHQGIARVGLHALDLAAREAVPLLRFADVPAPEDADADIFTLDLGGDIANPDSAFRVEASCDGVLVLSYGNRFYLCNPATARWAPLPSIHRDHVIVGFYARVPPGAGAAREYRLMYVNGSQESVASYWIRELRPLPDEAIYEIGRPMSPGMMHDLQILLLARLPPAHEAPPVLVRTILHWAPRNLSRRGIVLFDTVAEVFSLITAPPNMNLGFQLLELNGLVAIAARNPARTSIQIWVQQDHEKEPWELRFTVDLPETSLTASFGYDPFRSPSVYFIRQEVHVLLPCPHTLLHWTNGVVRQLYQYPRHWIITTPNMFQENLEMNTFLLAPWVNSDDDDDDDDDHEPPFKPAAGFEDQ